MSPTSTSTVVPEEGLFWGDQAVDHLKAELRGQGPNKGVVSISGIVWICVVLS